LGECFVNDPGFFKSTNDKTASFNGKAPMTFYGRLDLQLQEAWRQGRPARHP